MSSSSARKRMLLRSMLAAFTFVTLGSGSAAAQTVVARKVPAGSTVEAVINTTRVGTATPDAAGDASIPFNLQAVAGSGEIDANVYLDVCDKLYRVVIGARGSVTASPEAGCERRSVSGLFLVRRVTTLVINVDTVVPSVLLVQGAYDLTPEAPGRIWEGAPTGLVLFGAAGRGSFGRARALACGLVNPCTSEGTWGAFSAGADYWVTPFLAVTGSFVKPAQFDISGEGTGFDFDSYVDAYAITLGGKLGVPIGRARPYGHGGAAYHAAVSATTQTNDETTVTVDGVPQTIPGGTQAFEVQTEGWRWTFGGGLEVWMTRNFAVYGEYSRITMKADAREGEGSIDDALTSLGVGVRIRFGR